MSSVRNIVFIHGWGLNSAIWDSYMARLAELRSDLSLFSVDLPGYGHSSELSSSADLGELAEHCFEQAPDNALWVGWSLGGLVAMHAACLESARSSDRIQALQLINTTPKFTKTDNWPSGVDLKLFADFGQELAADYARTLKIFLLLQAGGNKGARQLASEAQSAICSLPAPSAETLMAGIKCLEQSDLREAVSDIKLPTQILCGTRDRVTNPASSQMLASLIGGEPEGNELVELDCGHAPFLSRPEETLHHLISLISRVERLSDRP